MKETKQIRIEEVVFRNNENGYSVLVVNNAEEEFTAVGFMPTVSKGRSYELTGEWKSHPNYGEQFSFSYAEEIMPATEDSIRDFLASGVLRGVGKKTAALIVSKFGEDTLRIIEQEPEKLTEISGIGVVKAESICEAFRQSKELANVVLYFQQYGIGAEYAMKLYKIYGPDTINIVESNPYQLIKDIFGVGFRKADNIALKMGFGREDSERIKSGIVYTLGYFVSEGNTFIPQAMLTEKTGELLEVPIEKIEDALVELAFDGTVKIEILEGRSIVFLMPYYLAELNVAASLMILNSHNLKPLIADIKGLISAAERDAGIILSENQKYAVNTTVAHGVSIITGGPGTGKTTIIDAIMRVLSQGGLNTAIAAPTGRAAKRITEKTGHSASTVHRLLEYSFSEDIGTMRFGKNQENPMDYDAVIVDEASMMDLLLADGLLNAIKPGTRLIFVGDADQLPPVGAGNVLRDMIESEYIYCVRLDEIFRQAQESMIIVNAHRINKGEYPACNEKDKDFFFMHKQGEKEMIATLKELCAKRLPQYYSECEPIRDIQVLTPVRKGAVGSINLNKELQAVLNPPRKEAGERKFGERIFREGDKVMQIKNNYGMEWKKRDDFTKGEGIFNGDIGFIESIDSDFNTMTVVFDEDKYVEYEFANLEELEHAYAITVHKSQGSEFRVIVMPISWFPPMLATRNLIYTAVTRGKEAVVLVGSQRKMEAMIDNNSTKERYSGLSARLQI